MKKSLIFVGMLSIGFAYAQEGNVGINTDQPKATLDIQPNATNLAGTTNQGILAPRLSKVRVANIETPVEGTLVYITDETASPISAYTGADTKVAKITEKGYYFYNGTEWVKTSATDGGEWKYDGVDAIVAKRANETTAQDLIQIKNGKGLQQFIGSPDATTLTYKGYNTASQQLENYTLFKPNADLKSVPNINYITSDALADTSIFENRRTPNHKTFVSDYKLFQLKPSHLDRVNTDNVSYMPYSRVGYFNNINKTIKDIWVDRSQIFLGENNSGTFEYTGAYQAHTVISGSNPMNVVRGIDSELNLSGSNTLGEVNGMRSVFINNNGFSGRLSHLYGNRSMVNFSDRGEIQNIATYDANINFPITSNATSKHNTLYHSRLEYLTRNTTKVTGIAAYTTTMNVNTLAETENVEGINLGMTASSQVLDRISSARFSATYNNKNADAKELQRMDGAVVTNNYRASAPINNYSGVIVHNKVWDDATGKIGNMRGIHITNELLATAAEVKNNYGIYINDIKGATNTNRAIHTEGGKIRFGDLAQTGAGDRVVYADENGVLKTGSANITATNGLQNTENMECNATNRGKMNFIQGEDGKSDVFGICMKNKNGNYYWGYMVGGNNPTNGTGTFGSGL